MVTAFQIIVSGILAVSQLPFETLTEVKERTKESTPSILPTIISLDYCADQYVLAIAQTRQIKALSLDADKNHSYLKNKAVGIKKIRGTKSEIAYYLPDIIVGDYFTTAKLGNIAEKLSIKNISLLGDGSVGSVFKNLNKIGKMIGRENTARSIIKDKKNILSTLGSGAKSKLHAAYSTPSGYTAGSGTYVNRLIKMAGFESYAEQHNIQGWGLLPLELIASSPPDIVITSFYDTNLKNRSNWSYGRHPKIEAMLKHTPVIDLPGSLLACGGLFADEALASLRNQGEKLGLYDLDKGESF